MKKDDKNDNNRANNDGNRNDNKDNESIIITGTGLAPTDHNITGLEPVEPIFEEINWQMKTISVAVKNSESAEE